MKSGMPLKVTLQSIQRVCFGFRHNAFGDAVIFNQQLFICYRSGSAHMSEDGHIVVMQYSLTGKKLSHRMLKVPQADLRDPHFCDSGNKLHLFAHTRHTLTHPKAETVSWSSTGHNSWSTKHMPGPEKWWLWRVTQHNDNHWGLGYLRSANQLNLYSGNLRSRMTLTSEAVLSLQKHGLGYPNESDLMFTSDNTLICVVRRDADRFTAQLGISHPPYRRWQWRDLGVYIGGPALLKLNDHNALLAGRYWDGQSLHTRLWHLNVNTAHLSTLAVLPSAGDNGYPGLALNGNRLFLSYYSSHIDNQCRQYLATFDIENNVTGN